MTRDSRNYLSRLALTNIIKSHEKLGHVSLESLASWNGKIKPPSKEGFVCKKQHEFIETSILNDNFNAEVIKHLLYTADILKKNRTGK